VGLPTTGNGRDVRVSVDGTDFRIEEQTPFDKAWFSHKFKGPGLRYEVGVCIQTGHIVWTNGPYRCGKWPDIKIAKEKLFRCLDAGEKVIADNGYGTSGVYTIIPKNIENPSVKHVHGMIRARHEIVNRRLKQWQVLGGGRYRAALHKHKKYFGAVAVITQVVLEHQSLPFCLANLI